MDRAPSTGKCDRNSDQRRSVFEQDEKLGRILAAPDRREIATLADERSKAFPCDEPRAALEDERERQHDINDARALDWGGVAHMA